MRSYPVTAETGAELLHLAGKTSTLAAAGRATLCEVAHTGSFKFRLSFKFSAPPSGKEGRAAKKQIRGVQNDIPLVPCPLPRSCLNVGTQTSLGAEP